MKKIMVLLGALLVSFVGAHSAAAQETSWQAIHYCQENGGQVVYREPYYGTNNVTPLRLAGFQLFCQFTSQSDGSRINILVSTLYTELPTLATSAYLFQPAYDGSSCEGNPASCYCTQLGGSDFGLIQGGGAWETQDSTNPDPQLEACIFPDNSSIDSWGLLYHSAGIIRGRGLKSIIRFKPNSSADAAVPQPKQPRP